MNGERCAEDENGYDIYKNIIPSTYLPYFVLPSSEPVV
jgi:hypothetical protein